jgi:hypothetical protein
MQLGTLLTSLIDGRPLRNAVVVALPSDVRVGGQCKDALDGFTVDDRLAFPAVDN